MLGNRVSPASLYTESRNGHKDTLISSEGEDSQQSLTSLNTKVEQDSSMELFSQPVYSSSRAHMIQPMCKNQSAVTCEYTTQSKQTFGQKYYLKYMSISDVDRSAHASNFCTTADNKCEEIPNEQFQIWKFQQQERKHIVDDVTKDTRGLFQELNSAFMGLNENVLKTVSKVSDELTAISDHQDPSVISQILEGQAEMSKIISEQKRELLQLKEYLRSIELKLECLRSVIAASSVSDIIRKAIHDCLTNDLKSDVRKIDDTSEICNVEVQDSEEYLYEASCGLSDQGKQNKSISPKKFSLALSKRRSLRTVSRKQAKYGSTSGNEASNYSKNFDMPKAIRRRLSTKRTYNERATNYFVDHSPRNALNDTFYSHSSTSKSESQTGMGVPTEFLSETALQQPTAEKFQRSNEAAKRRMKIISELSSSDSVIHEISKSIQEGQVCKNQPSPPE